MDVFTTIPLDTIVTAVAQANASKMEGKLLRLLRMLRILKLIRLIPIIVWIPFQEGISS